MGANTALLLVDADARSLRVLEVSLKKAGFDVRTAETAAAALEAAKASPPELIITESELPDGNGFDLCSALKSDDATKNVGVVFLSAAATPNLKIDAINAGADDFLTKPVLVKDIITRLRALLDARASASIAKRERPGNLSGNLASMGVVDLLQVMETGSKSGIVHVSSDPTKSGGYVAHGQERGTMFFRDGDVVDAKLGELTGAEVVYRMLLWEDGVFEIEFKQISREDVVKLPTQTVLLEGMRRVDEWSKLEAELPPLSSKPTLDYATLGRMFPVVPEETQLVLHLFDGRRTLFQVVDDAPMPDTEALGIIAELHDRGVLSGVPQKHKPEAATDDVEEWLSQPPPSRVSDDPLPSALGRAVIPSPHTASEILRAEDPLARELEDAPTPTQTAVPEPLPEPSIVLSRHTVPANKAVPLTQRPETRAPIPLTETPQGAPRLQIQRVASTIGRLPTAEADDDGWEPVRTAPSVRSQNGDDSRVTVADEPLPAQRFEDTAAIDHAVQRAIAHEETADTRIPVAASTRSPSYVIAPAAPPPWPSSQPTTPPRNLREGQSGAMPRAPATETRELPPRAEAPTLERLPPEDVPTRDEITDPGISPPSTAAGFVDSPAAALANAPTQRFDEPAESVGSFFDRPQESPDDDYGWEDGGDAWKRRAPGLLLVTAGLAVVGVLVFGAKEKRHDEVVAEKPAAAAAAKEALWPKSPQDGVVIDGAPEAETPEARAKAAMEKADPELKPAPEAKAPEAKAPEAKAPEPVAKAPEKAEPEKPKYDRAASVKLVEQGEGALASGNYTSARSLLRRAVAADPNNAEAHAALSLVYVELGSDRSARGSAWRALKIDSSQARAHLVLAMVAVNAGDMERAKEGYQSYLKHAPNGKHANEVRSLLKNLP